MKTSSVWARLPFYQRVSIVASTLTVGVLGCETIVSQSGEKTGKVREQEVVGDDANVYETGAPESGDDADTCDGDTCPADAADAGTCEANTCPADAGIQACTGNESQLQYQQCATWTNVTAQNRYTTGGSALFGWQGYYQSAPNTATVQLFAQADALATVVDIAIIGLSCVTKVNPIALTISTLVGTAISLVGGYMSAPSVTCNCAYIQTTQGNLLNTQTNINATCMQSNGQCLNYNVKNCTYWPDQRPAPNQVTTQATPVNCSPFWRYGQLCCSTATIGGRNYCSSPDSNYDNRDHANDYACTYLCNNFPPQR